MKQKKKKPTMSQVETVVNSLIVENQNLRLNLEAVQRVLSSYIEFKKDEKKFKQYIEEKNGKENNENNDGSPEEK